MKRSTTVLLALSGSLLSGCGQRPSYVSQSSQGSGLVTSESFGDSEQVYTNNTYIAERGYYHAPYHSWYPFPYNHYVAGSGYYHGGSWRPQPHQSTITASKPARATASPARSSSVTRGGFVRGSSHFSSAS